MSGYEMNRSRTQLALTYAPGSFFTFEGGLGACRAVPVRTERAENLGQLVETQILELITERARNWREQGLATPRGVNQPPIEEDLVVHPNFKTGGQISLLRDRFEFLIPDRMGYQPMPLTFVCRQCKRLKGYESAEAFERDKDTITSDCQQRGGSCANDWEQLDVAFVHWSGGFAPITLKENHWDAQRRRVYARPISCTCGNGHFKLLRDAPVFSKWRLQCTACDLARDLPNQQDPDTLEILGDGIASGANWRIETNMEPISVRANAAYYVQSDRLLAFSDDTWFSKLRLGQNGALIEFLAEEYHYPIATLSDDQKAEILERAGLREKWANYCSLREFLRLQEGKAPPSALEGLRAGIAALENEWRDKLPPDYRPTQALARAVRERSHWPRRFDPIRQAVEHRTLRETLLGPGSLRDVVNVRAPDPSLLPGLSAADASAAIGMIGRELDLLGIEDMRLLRKFPVCEFSFGYTRTSTEPYVERRKGSLTINVPVRLNLFERVHLGEGSGPKHPIYVLKQDNEAFYVRLREETVVRWLQANGLNVTLPHPDARLGSMLIDQYGDAPFSKWLDEYRGNPRPQSRNAFAYVYTLLHTMAHQFMHELAQVSGLDLGNMSEHLFVPDLAFVVYRRGTTMDLNYLSSAWRANTDPTVGNVVLRRMLEPGSLRCGSGTLCDNRGGACPDCILIPEVSCVTRNNLLSRSVLRGVGRPHWDASSAAPVVGYYSIAGDLARQALSGSGAG